VRHVVQRSASLMSTTRMSIDHGEHHLAQVFGLLLFARSEIDLADLGDAFDDVRDLLTKLLRMSTMVTEVSSTES